MGTFMLGRVGLEGISAGEVDGWSESGARVSVSGHTSYGSVEESLILRSQFMGLADSPDESFVPLVWSEQPEVDGYYRVLDVRFDSSVERAPFGVLDWQIELERVLGFAAPLLELTTLGARRASSHLTGSQGVHLFAVPSDAKSVAVYYPTTGTYSGTVGGFTRVGATGDMRRIGSSTEQHVLVQFYLPPADHYAGAASLYVGEGMMAAVGRQIRNTPTAWRISNGLIELEAVSSTTFDLRLRMWLSGAWSPWVDCEITQGAGVSGELKAPHSITVLRNGPEEVAVRLLTTATTGDAVPVTVDFSLKRGARHFAVELRATAVNDYGFKCPSFAGATSVTTDEDRRWKLIGGVHMVFMAPYALTQIGDIVSQAVLGSSWSFGVGMVDAADALDDHQKTAAEYFFPSSAKQSVVAQ